MHALFSSFQSGNEPNDPTYPWGRGRIFQRRRLSLPKLCCHSILGNMGGSLCYMCSENMARNYLISRLCTTACKTCISITTYNCIL